MTESEARAAVAGVGLTICAMIAALAWGQTALNYVTAAWMLWLTWDRSNLHEHAQMRWRRTIRALAALRKRHDDELDDLRIIVMSPHLPTFADEPVAVANLNDDATVQVSAAKPEPDGPATDEMPALPGIPTEPSGIPLQVQAALLAAERPSPTPRDLSDEFPAPDSDEAKAKTAAWVESELEKIRARIDAAQGAS